MGRIPRRSARVRSVHPAQPDCSTSARGRSRLTCGKRRGRRRGGAGERARGVWPCAVRRSTPDGLRRPGQARAASRRRRRMRLPGSATAPRRRRAGLADGGRRPGQSGPARRGGPRARRRRHPAGAAWPRCLARTRRGREPAWGGAVRWHAQAPVVRAAAASDPARFVHEYAAARAAIRRSPHAAAVPVHAGQCIHRLSAPPRAGTASADLPARNGSSRRGEPWIEHRPTTEELS